MISCERCLTKRRFGKSSAITPGNRVAKELANDVEAKNRIVPLTSLVRGFLMTKEGRRETPVRPDIVYELLPYSVHPQDCPSQ